MIYLEALGKVGIFAKLETLNHTLPEIYNISLNYECYKCKIKKLKKTYFITLKHLLLIIFLLFLYFGDNKYFSSLKHFHRLTFYQKNVKMLLIYCNKLKCNY